MIAPLAIVLSKLSPADHDYPRLLAEGLQRLGWTVAVLPAENLRRPRIVERLQVLLARSGAQAIFSINFARALASASLLQRVPYVCWNEVYPLSFDTPPLPASNQVWCFDSSKSLTAWWRTKNVNAAFFPLGFDERVFRPDGQTPRWDVGFVGNGLAHLQATFENLLARLRASPPRSSAAPAVTAALRRLLERVQLTTFAELERRDGCDVARLVQRIGSDLPVPERDAIVELALGAPVLRVAVAGLLARRQRLETLGRVARLADLQVFGRDWQQTEVASCAAPPRAFDQTAATFAQSRIALHIQRFYARNVNDRMINVPACGAFLLARQAEAIEEVFEPGVEIAVWSDLEELEDKLRFYLRHERERRRIAAAGCRRAHAQYRFSRRLGELLRACGLPRPALGYAGRPAADAPSLASPAA